MTAISLARSRPPKTTPSTTPPPHPRGAITTVALVGILTLIEAVLILAVIGGSLGLDAERSQGLGPDHPPPPRPLPAGAAVQRLLS
jgi:hypothetical protein